MKKIIFALLTAIASFSTFAVETQKTPQVVVTDLQTSRNENGFPVIRGIATNVSASLVKDVFVKFNLYDERGNLIGNTLDNASNLEPGGRWVINVVKPLQFHSFKVTEVNTYQR